MTDADNRRRNLARERTEAYRDRRRHGRVLVPVEVKREHLAALERLGLLDKGERARDCIAWAVTRFLDAARHVTAMGDALWPASEEDGNDA